ncbi:MAG: hypothetical protein H7A40_04230 [Chlamydiales bacterium]|nr:hypothetical protein [Chlamydiales bacterium]
MLIQLYFIVTTLIGVASFGDMPKSNPAKATEQKMMEAKAAVTSKTSKGQESPDVLLIQPSARAADWVAAYQYLSKYAAENSISFKLNDGSTIHNITNVAALPGGTLLTFTLNTVSGLKYKVVKIEDIADIIQD